jgi:RNA polymerase sigma factor (TIGR02999 family)
MADGAEEITNLLRAWAGGEAQAFERLAPLVYRELHRLARHCMNRERAGHTLQTTALVHEAFLRLLDINQIQWQDRAHFFAMASTMMRRVLVEFARARTRYKRGGHARTVTLDDNLAASPLPVAAILDLDEALDRLARQDSRKARVVELRFFGGLSVEETAEILQVSPQSILRDWSLARAWLRRELSRQHALSARKTWDRSP